MCKLRQIVEKSCHVKQLDGGKGEVPRFCSYNAAMFEAGTVHEAGCDNAFISSAAGSIRRAVIYSAVILYN